MIPANLERNPILDRWVGFLPGGRIRIRVGKVEIGQGILTALAQIAAEELDAPFTAIEVVAADTEDAPDEGLTVGSMSIEMSGAALRQACAEVRGVFLKRLAAKTGGSTQSLDVKDGRFMRGGEPTGEDYWSLAAEVDLARAADGVASPKSASAYRVVGTSVPRVDLPDKLFGGGFVHDLTLPGMLHARVLRQPSPAATLAALDEVAIRRATTGDVEIVQDGSFVAFLAESEHVANAAVTTAQLYARWENARQLAPDAGEPDWLTRQPARDMLSGPETPPRKGVSRHEARYARPYLSHASIGPSCAVAEFRDGRLTVWSHTQGPYPIKPMLARATGLQPDAITVRHVQGAGCYGHNGADDAAADAALLAVRRPGRPIRVQWRREDEFGFAPAGPAMVVDCRAELDAAGRPIDWTTEIWSGSHTNRARLLPESALPQSGATPGAPPPFRFSGAARNGVPYYDITDKRLIDHMIEAPIRTSALRGLGAPANIFAIESFVDELAVMADTDPVDYRLSLTADPRARRVIQRAAKMASWSKRGAAGSGTGLGLAFARYKNDGAYVAVAAKVAVGQQVTLEQIWCAADCGLTINPDGAKNQLEGGAIMAASWTLKEQLKLDDAGVASVTFGDYPLLRFSEVPPIEVVLVGEPHERPLGLGEASMGPTCGAIANAVAHALGARIRGMPLTRERIAEALLR